MHNIHADGEKALLVYSPSARRYEGETCRTRKQTSVSQNFVREIVFLPYPYHSQESLGKKFTLQELGTYQRLEVHFTIHIIYIEKAISPYESLIRRL
jgi:hypothetical protein